MLRQDFPFRSTIIDYIIKNASLIVELKLFKCCKQIGTPIQRDNFYKVDTIVIHSKRPLFKLKLIDDKIVCWVNSSLKFQHTVTTKFLDIRTTLTPPIVSKINHFLIKKLRLADLGRISFESFKKFLTPNLILLELIRTVITDFENAGMIITVEACNLKFLEITVANISLIKELAKIENKTKFENVSITFITTELEIDEIVLFIQNQLAPGWNLSFNSIFPQGIEIIKAAFENRPDLHKVFNYKSGNGAINFVKL